MWRHLLNNMQEIMVRGSRLAARLAAQRCTTCKFSFGRFGGLVSSPIHLQFVFLRANNLRFKELIEYLNYFKIQR